MGKAGKLKQRPPDTGNRIVPAVVSAASSDNDHPVFAFKMVKGFSVPDCEKHEKAAFADKLHELSQKTWRELTCADRTGGLGSEHIKQQFIKQPKPPFITEDVTILSFRCSQKCRIVGFRLNREFHIVWLDRNHSVY